LEPRLPSSSQKSPVERRAEELDTIAAILPMERRDELAELLTDRDIQTLIWSTRAWAKTRFAP
jgi:hypothetical protein